MPRKNELSTREGNCASPASHRNEFPAEYSLTGCSPAEPASASPAELILQPQHLFCQYNTANGILHNPSVSHKRAHSNFLCILQSATDCTKLHNSALWTGRGYSEPSAGHTLHWANDSST